MMIEFEIKDFELGGHKTKVTAQGIAEAMLDYLPWTSLNARIIWFPSNGIYTIIDLHTDFMYEITVKQQPTGITEEKERMNVRDLIEKLKEMDQDADVGHLWDGCVRSAIEHVYMSKSGECVTSDHKMVCYHNCDRPIDAPAPEQDKYWETAKV